MLPFDSCPDFAHPPATLLSQNGPGRLTVGQALAGESFRVDSSPRKT